MGLVYRSGLPNRDLSR